MSTVATAAAPRIFRSLRYRWQRVITDVVNAVGPGRVAAGHHAVKYYEVWNEPDWPIFFQGSPDQFANNIAIPGDITVARYQVSANPDVVIVCDSEALLPFLDGRHPAGVAVEGDATALALVQRWVKRAQSG